MSESAPEPQEPSAESQRPKDAMAERIKNLAALIAALTALITAAAALIRPADTTATQHTYTELSTALKEVSDATARNHDDLVKLRGFLEGWIDGQRQHRPVLAEEHGAPADEKGQPQRPHGRHGGGAEKSADTGPAAPQPATPAAPQPATPPAPAPAPLIPELGPAPRPYLPRPFQQIQEAAPEKHPGK